jgi:hypothetical protein
VTQAWKPAQGILIQKLLGEPQDGYADRCPEQWHPHAESDEDKPGVTLDDDDEGYLLSLNLKR